MAAPAADHAEDQHNKRPAGSRTAPIRMRKTAEKPAATSSVVAAPRYGSQTPSTSPFGIGERPAPLEPDAAAVVAARRRDRLGRHVDLARVQAEVVLAGYLYRHLCENRISGARLDVVPALRLLDGGFPRRQTRHCKTRWWTADRMCGR